MNFLTIKRGDERFVQLPHRLVLDPVSAIFCLVNNIALPGGLFVGIVENGQQAQQGLAAEYYLLGMSVEEFEKTSPPGA